jgi:dihydrodipicolinate synthase/N-acetylneuraminate lyase
MVSIAVSDLLDDPIAHYPAATVATFDPTTGDLPRRRLDHLRNQQFLAKLATVGVPAVLVASSTGHGHVRSVNELREWFRSSADVGLGTTVRMALLRPEDGEQENRRLVIELAALGYPIVFVRPGTDLAHDASDQDVVANIRPLVQEAADCGLAVGVYSIPDVSGVALSAEAAARLVEGPGGDHIVAVKVTEADYQTSTLRFLAHPALKRLKIVQGWDPHLARALRDGPRYDTGGRQRSGVTSGPMSLAVFQYMHILDAARDGQWDEVEASQQAVTALFGSMQDDPAKFADLQRAKYIMGLGHPLTSTVDQHHVDRVLAALGSLPRADDRSRLARSLDLMGDGPLHKHLAQWY